MGFKYAMGICHTWPFSGRFLDCFAGLVKPKEGFDWIRIEGLPVDEARDVIVRSSLERGNEWLLLVDADMGFHPQSWARLVERTKQDKSIKMISGLCVTRYIPPVPTVFGEVTRIREDGREFLHVDIAETFEWLLNHPEAVEECPTVMDPSPADALVKKNGSGAAFLMVHRDVFEAVEGPWFVRDELKKGEDFYFFQNARKAGFQLWIDRSVLLGHEWAAQYAGVMDFLVWAVGMPLVETALDAVKEGGGGEEIIKLREFSLAARRYET